MPTDRELLRRYSQQGDESAFAELVRRHADLVYSVARRVTCNGALAEDVTQAVFTQLAQQAGRLSHYETLSGWLHTTARHRSIDAIRGEERRRIREQEATAMQNINSTPETNWAEIGPLLDEAVDQLREDDRKAVLLRYFKNLSHQEVGAVLGLSENSANKRVERALEKLREHFANRGVKASSALLATTITGNSVQAAPVGLAARVTGRALAAARAVTTGSLFLKIIFMSTPTKLLAAAAIVIIAAAITLNWPHSEQAPRLPNLGPTGPTTTATLPKPPILAQVAMPVVAPAILSKSTSPAAPVSGVVASPAQFVAGPQTDLKAAIATGAHFILTHDALSFCKTLMPPDALAGKGAATVEDYVAKVINDVDFDHRLTQALDVFDAIQNLSPEISSDGNLATYRIDPPVENHSVVTFYKVNGFWYLKDF